MIRKKNYPLDFPKRYLPVKKLLDEFFFAYKDFDLGYIMMEAHYITNYIKNHRVFGEESREMGNYFYWVIRRWMLFRCGLLPYDNCLKGNFDIKEDILDKIPDYEALEDEFTNLDEQQRKEYYFYRIDQFKEHLSIARRVNNIVAPGFRADYEKIPFKVKKEYEKEIGPLPDYSDMVIPATSDEFYELIYGSLNKNADNRFYTPKVEKKEPAKIGHLKVIKKDTDISKELAWKDREVEEHFDRSPSMRRLAKTIIRFADNDIGFMIMDAHKFANRLTTAWCFGENTSQQASYMYWAVRRWSLYKLGRLKKNKYLKGNYGFIDDLVLGIPGFKIHPMEEPRLTLKDKWLYYLCRIRYIQLYVEEAKRTHNVMCELLKDEYENQIPYEIKKCYPVEGYGDVPDYSDMTLARELTNEELNQLPKKNGYPRRGCYWLLKEENGRPKKITLEEIEGEKDQKEKVIKQKNHLKLIEAVEKDPIEKIGLSKDFWSCEEYEENPTLSPNP